MTSPAWQLIGFIEVLDRWISVEDPSAELRLIVTGWLVTRFDDPHQGMRREQGFDNLWFGPIPGSRHGRGAVVVCSYWIDEKAHTVSFNDISTLNLPV